jgi:hypothetical protein
MCHWLFSIKGLLMSEKEPPKQRRRMFVGERPTLQDRISQRAKDLEARAKQMPAGLERDALLRLARQMNARTIS